MTKKIWYGIYIAIVSAVTFLGLLVYRPDWYIAIPCFTFMTGMSLLASGLDDIEKRLKDKEK